MLRLFQLKPANFMLVQSRALLLSGPAQAPVIPQKMSLAEPESFDLEVKGRNSRRPKKANHGARPCSSVMRKL